MTALFSTSCSAPVMTTSPAHGLVLARRPGTYFVATTTLIYAVSEWIKYELMLTPTSPPQLLPIRMIEWGPDLVTQVFALAAILGALALLIRSSRRLYRKPAQCFSSSYLVRLAESVCSGAVAAVVYFLGVMVDYEIWVLNFWTLQIGIVVGAQYPLFKVWGFSIHHDVFLN